MACCVCALHVDYCMLSSIYCAFYATSYLLQVACRIRNVNRYWASHDAYCMLHVVCCFLRMFKYKVHVASYVWGVNSGGPSGSCNLHVESRVCMLHVSMLYVAFCVAELILCTDELQKQGNTR